MGRLACPFVTIKAKLRRFVPMSRTRRAHHSPLGFLLCSAHPKRFMWIENGLEMPNTVLSRVERK
jgi:hypothetical protein